MYKSIIRPLLFLFNPEKVHAFVFFCVKLACKIPGIKPLLRFMFTFWKDKDGIMFCGLRFKGRVGLAAGFDKNADFLTEAGVFGFSFIEIGTITPLAQPGNPKPRLFRLVKDQALVNRMGFNNNGVDYAVRQLQKYRKRNIIIGGNIGKNTLTDTDNAADDYARCFERLYPLVDYIAVNISCPNIKGMEKLQDTGSLQKILDAIIKIRNEQPVRKPVLLKISPDLDFNQLDETLKLCRKKEIDGIIATNTTTSRTNLITSEKEIASVGSGGLSGKPLHDRTVELVRYICKQKPASFPVIAVGGIMSARDAIDMIEAGASLVQIYTGFIYEGPALAKRLNRAIYNHFIAGSRFTGHF